MRKYLLMLFCFSGFAQTSEMQVIYATTSKNVNIFFQSPITTAIVGSETFSFGFNREEKSTYGILKAIAGLESNLLITTENGNIFSFIVRYKKDISELNYFINDSLSIGNTKVLIGSKTAKVTDSNSQSLDMASVMPVKEIVSKTITVNDYEDGTDKAGYKRKDLKNDLYETDKNSYYDEKSEKEVEKERYFVRFYDSNSKVYLRLKNIFYDRDELYFTIVIDNKSSLDYDIEDLTFFITARNTSRRTSSQRIAYEPVYVYKAPERVNANSQTEAVYVFKKFSINSEKILLVSLSEFKGERNINLEIPNSNINNPN